MFDVGLAELAMIALVALLVLGPEKLPRAARTAGLYLRKARATWHSVRADIERELAAEDMKQAMKDTARDVGVSDIRQTLQATERSLRHPLGAAAAAPARDAEPTASPTGADDPPVDPTPRD